MDFFCLLLKKIGKNLSNKYNQTLFDPAKKCTTDALKIASKRAIQKTKNKQTEKAEATGDLIVDKIADKITSVSKKSTTELHSKELPNEEDVEITTHKKRYISPVERQKIIDKLRLVPKNY